MISRPDRSLFYSSDMRAMYIGQVDTVLTFTTASAVLVVSIDRSLEFFDTANNQPVYAHSFLIPAGVTVAIDTHGSRIVECFLDALNADFERLLRNMRNRFDNSSGRHVYANLDSELIVKRCAEYILHTQPSKARGASVLDQCLAALMEGTCMVTDERIAHAVQIIQSTSSKNMSVESIAKLVGLSVPRFSQLFKQFVGVPVRKYRLWCRLIQATHQISQGGCITSAALEAGFSDHSHYCRVLKDMLGVRPSLLRETGDTVILHAA